MTALIACVGNPLVSDDAVGYHVYLRLLRRRLPSTVRLEHLALFGIELVELFAAEDVCILVDAARTGEAPGTVRVHDLSDTRVLPTAVCAHDIGVGEALAICRALYPEREPKSVKLVTVEGDCFDELHPRLTPAVLKACPDALTTVLSLVSHGGINAANVKPCDAQQ